MHHSVGLLTQLSCWRRCRVNDVTWSGVEIGWWWRVNTRLKDSVVMSAVKWVNAATATMDPVQVVAKKYVNFTV